MKKALLLSLIFVAIISSAFAFSNNSSGYYSKGIIVGGASNNNSSGYYSTFIISEQPIGQGTTDGFYSYVGFYPLLNLTYYVPFGNGTFIYHCNPDATGVGGSVICTGNLIDNDGKAINNAHISWELFDTNGTSYAMGDFTFLGNGAYKFDVPITQAGNFTTGDYYFKFTSSGFGVDYVFPLSISSNTQALGIGLALGLIVLAFAILTTKVSDSLPHLQIIFLVFSEVMALISLRVFNELTGLQQFLSGYKIMMWIIVATIIFIFIELFINIFIPLLRKRKR